MRRPALLALALSVIAVAVACSHGTASFPLLAGEYAVSAWTGSSGCAFVDADPLNGERIEVYGNGGSLRLGSDAPGILVSLANNRLSSSVHLPQSFEVFGKLFCILDDLTTISGAVTGANRATLTVTDTYTPGSLNVSNQCQWAAGSTPISYPCTVTQTFTMALSGPANPDQPVPAPPLQSGTISASSDSAALSRVSADNSSGQNLEFSATLGSNLSAESALDPWFCNAPNGSDSPNYVIFNAIANSTAFYSSFHMLVATNAWSVGSHPITPETVFLAVGSSNSHLAFAASSGSSGTLVLSSAGTVADTTGNSCRFSVSGIHATGVAVAVPHTPAPGTALRRILRR